MLSGLGVVRRRMMGIGGVNTVRAMPTVRTLGRLALIALIASCCALAGLDIRNAGLTVSWFRYRQVAGARPALLFTGGILLFLAAWSVLELAYGRRKSGSEPARSDNGAHEQLPVASYKGPIEERPIITYVSPELEELLGYSMDDWASDPRLWSRLIHAEDRERVLTSRAHHLCTGDRFVAEYRIMTRERRVVWVHDEAVVIGSAATAGFVHGVMIDITERKQAEEALEHQALHDNLTGLPNRTLLHDRLQQAIIAARRDSKTLALLLMDLDRFKEINDTFGHRYGDLLLRQVVNQVRDALRESDTVARLGGDEFAILLPSVDGRGAVRIVEKMLALLRQPFRAEGHVLDVGASIGIALFPDHGHDAHTLLQRADVAMYMAKQSDLGYAVYQANQDPYSPSRLALIRELREAIDADKLVLHYQPKADFQNSTAGHVEALVRWYHPEQGPVPAKEVIALAEHAGLIKPLTLWVLEAALRQCRGWRSAGLDITVAVNLSPRSLHDPDLVETIRGMLEARNVSPNWLEVEITENALMADPVGALNTLEKLHGMGVCIAIDDFGIGYSSLAYLKNLPVDQIKIDKSFVLDMADNRDSRHIVQAVVDLGHRLNLRVVAEGVEDRHTWDLLSGMGCDSVQGFLLSHPLPAADATRWLRDAALRPSMA